MCVSGKTVELSNFSSIYQNVLRYNLLFIILSILNIILILNYLIFLVFIKIYCCIICYLLY